MIVRAAHPADAGAVSALEAELFGGGAWSGEVVEGELANATRRVVVAEVGEDVVGYAILFAVGETADLQRVGVEVRHQRRGLARALLAALALDTYPRVLLEVRSDNDAALALYEAAGFHRVSTRRRYYADGCDAVVMQRDGTAAD